MIRLRNVPLSLDQPETALTDQAEKLVKTKVSQVKVIRRAVDARRKNHVHFVYTLDVAVQNEASVLSQCRDACPVPDNSYTPPAAQVLPENRPVVVGFGPAGMFASLSLAMAGLHPLVVERGEDAASRADKVRRMRQEGILDPESNMQFGEGGAGAFSDGKLSTGVKDPRIPWILEQLVLAGAPREILIDAKPHIGTDLLPGICQNIRLRIVSLGGEVLFSTRLTGIRTQHAHIAGIETSRGDFPCSHLILACGHSARDTFRMLAPLIPICAKPFAMGVRIEHLQSQIDRAQYGPFAGHPALPPADYALAVTLKNGRRCYSFCMCPGGEVVPAASEEGMVCTNGASPSRRDGKNANAALLTALAPEDFPFPGVFGGLQWQQELECLAYEAAGGGYRAPIQTVGSFLHSSSSRTGSVVPSYQPGTAMVDLHKVLPPAIRSPLAQALPLLDQKLHGFAQPDAVLTAPETRSSCPIRLERDQTLQSPGMVGLYPCGEGAGWSGGIMSSAIDGLRCAQALVKNLKVEFSQPSPSVQTPNAPNAQSPA